MEAVSLRSRAGISSDPVAFFVSRYLSMDSTSISVRTSLVKIGWFVS